MTVRFVAVLALLVSFMPWTTRSAIAEPAAGRIGRANMPPGWQWPPSPAMQQGGERCLRELHQAGVSFTQRTRAPGKIATPVVVPSMEFSGLRVRQMFGGRAPVMDCHMALALARISSSLRAQGIREMVVAGFYQNRRARLRGRSLPILSRHALGLAVDIRAFVTDQGRTVSVLNYRQEPLLRRIEAALVAGGQLRAVVTPGNDAAHKNHFHISATMMIEGQQPERSVDISELLAHLR